MNINNFIETKYRELQESNLIDLEYLDLYKDINHVKLKELIISLHSNFVKLFRRMNDRLPTNDYAAHFWADESRDLIKIIDITFSLQKSLSSTQYAFKIDNDYETFMLKCRDFLKTSGGSEIPPHTDSIEIYYTIPIFVSTESVTTSISEKQLSFELKQIGAGSYANVYKYNDTFYNKPFVLKRAKKELTYKEIERFAREFQEMKKLSSPYITEVYNYNPSKKEYIMEFMDVTLYEYIQSNNNTITIEKRKNIISQILRAFSYINAQNILHRDISPNNILIKHYDDVDVIKISDFGLVKIPDSTLTSLYSDFKGSFNDPALATEGFENYTISHETYALTKIVFFVMTGKTNTSNIKDVALKKFILKGLNVNKSQRFTNAQEMLDYLKKF